MRGNAHEARSLMRPDFSLIRLFHRTLRMFPRGSLVRPRYPAAISVFARFYLTAISRLSHGYLTAISRQSHGYLTALSRLSPGYPRWRHPTGLCRGRK
mgnify:CR=1 FL=1